jgi:molybdate transport system ATP-binding protein
MTAEPAPELSVDVDVAVGAFTVAAAIEVGPAATAIVGPNGSGKTSLLLAMLGIRTPRRGRIALGEDVLFDASRGIDVPPEGRGFAYLPQDFGLFPHLSALHNVSFAVACREVGMPAAERLRVAREHLDRFGIARLADRRPAQLSGGERQRVALARAVASAPRALFLDEPTAALDVGARAEVRTLLAEIVRALAIPAVIVTHDLGDIRALCPRVAVMDGGRLVACGAREEIERTPPTGFAAQLFTVGA